MRTDPQKQWERRGKGATILEQRAVQMLFTSVQTQEFFTFLFSCSVLFRDNYNLTQLLKNV